MSLSRQVLALLKRKSWVTLARAHKYTTKFEDAKNHFPSSEIDKILSFINDLLDIDRSLEKNCNPFLWQKIQEIWDAIKKPNLNFVIHFCGNRQGLITTEAERVKNKLSVYRSFEIKEHTLSSIVSMVLQKKTPSIDKELPLVENQYFERLSGNLKGLVATIHALDIINLIHDSDDPSKVLLDIFNDNVRIYLTNKNQINQKIIESALSDQNNEFWYLNNGITITCDSFDYLPSSRHPILRMKNVQIVNGGQTSNALFEAHTTDTSKLKNVYVLVRIYETKYPEISQRIAESTNSQTPIRSRDLRSNDSVQKKIENEFLDMGYFYERKTNQFIDKVKEKRIDAVGSGQAYLAYNLELPEVAYNQKSKLFGEYYDQVFNNNISAKILLLPWQLVKVIEERKKNFQKLMRTNQGFDKDFLFLIYGTYHVLYTTALICDLKKLNKFDLDVATKEINTALEIISEVIKRAEKNEPSFSLANFFKDKGAKRKIQLVINELFEKL